MKRKTNTKTKASYNPNQCPICKQGIVTVIRKGKGGVIVRRESCCGITRVREVKAESLDLVKGYVDCKAWR